MERKKAILKKIFWEVCKVLEETSGILAKINKIEKTEGGYNFGMEVEIPNYGKVSSEYCFVSTEIIEDDMNDAVTVLSDMLRREINEQNPV